MPKIALISEHASPLAIGGGTDSGGQNVYVANVARQMTRRGWTVDVFCRRDDAMQIPVVEWLPGVRVINVPAGPAIAVPKERLLPYMNKFERFMVGFMAREKEAYDLIHANFFMSGLVGLKLRHLFGIPLVMTFHALGKVRRLHHGKHDGFPALRDDIENRIVKEADCLVAECPQDHHDLVSLYGADPKKIEVIPCGFEPAEFGVIDRCVARNRLDWDSEAFTLLQLGRIVPRKGIDLVIRAVARLRSEFGIDARLQVVGGNSDIADPRLTPEIGRLAALAKMLGVDDRVTFAGRKARDQLNCYYSAADVFVTTPWYEPFGITPIEAMACAIPVVGADVGGIRHSVVDGKTGFLVPPKDTAKLAARIAYLAQHEDIRRAMGELGSIRANRYFTWAKVTRDLHHLYRRLLVATPQKALHVSAAALPSSVMPAPTPVLDSDLAQAANPPAMEPQ